MQREIYSTMMVSVILFTSFFAIWRFTVTNDYHPQDTTNGFNLHGYESRIYNNTMVTIRGQINLYDHSTLIFENSSIIYDLDYNRQFGIDVHNEATLIINDCEIESIDYKWVFFSFFESATIHFKNFSNDLEDWAPWTSCEGYVKYLMENSVAWVTISKDFYGNLTATHSNRVYFELMLKPGEVYDETLPRNYTDYWECNFYDGSVTVIESFIQKLDVDLFPGVNATIRDTPYIDFGWRFGDVGPGSEYSEPDIPRTIEGVRVGYYADFFIQGDNANLHLINSSIDQGWWPMTTGNYHLTVIDNDLVDPRAEDTSNFTAIDSDIHYFTGIDNSYSHIINSSIEQSIVALNNAVVELTNTSFYGSVAIDENATIIINGEIIDEDEWNSNPPTSPPPTTSSPPPTTTTPPPTSSTPTFPSETSSTSSTSETTQRVSLPLLYILGIFSISTIFLTIFLTKEKKSN